MQTLIDQVRTRIGKLDDIIAKADEIRESDEKILVIFGGALGSGDVRMIKRSAVSSYCFTKRFLRSSVSIVLPDETLEFTGVQAARKDLFDWAMARHVPKEVSEQ